MLNKHVGVPSSIALLATTLSLPAAEPIKESASQNTLATPSPASVTTPSITALNYSNSPLSQVLDDIAEKSGLIIFTAVDTNAKVSIALRGAISGTPLIDALSAALAPHKMHLELSGRLLKILPEAAARYTGPVTLLSRTNEISKSPTLGTVILPLSTIEPGGLIATLQPYLPENTVAIASADANALVLHGSQRELSRVITIARLLDGAPLGASQISVVPLQHADSTPMAQTIRDVFSAENTASLTNAPSGIITAPDSHSNTIIMRGPAEVLYAAELLVHQLDTKRFEASEFRIFRLRYADASDIATVIDGIFPKGTTEDFQVEATTTPRVQNRDDVVAVPDPRSNTLILRAPTSIVPTLGGLIATLDRDSDKAQKVHVFNVANADPVVVAARLQELFQATAGTIVSSSSQATSALLQRAQQQTQTTTTATTRATGQRQQAP